MTARNYDFCIETSRTGEHFITFPRRYEDLNVPEQHEQKMAWIRGSFVIVLHHIQEREALVRLNTSS